MPLPVPLFGEKKKGEAGGGGEKGGEGEAGGEENREAALGKLNVVASLGQPAAVRSAGKAA
jgi:hypothetical protein